MIHEIFVLMDNREVGKLFLTNGKMNFQYSNEWIAQNNPMALSQSLPIRPEVFDDDECRPFFAGLLPENNLRQLIAQKFHISNKNDFGLLKAIGGECAGAISFQPSKKKALTDNTPSIEWLNTKELLQVLKELPHRPMLIGKHGIRLSLAGAQDKLPVVFDGKQIGLTKGSQASTHILKTPIPDAKESVFNEAFCLTLANSIGLPSADTKVFEVKENYHILLVARYDRTTNANGEILRIHQEDFCQALGIYPEMKYQSEGGPSIIQCFDLLRRVTHPCGPEILKLLDAIIFNVLVGNNDAHGKNFSLLHLGQKVQLTPLYDILSTAVYKNFTTKMAMKIGGKYEFDRIFNRHWYKLAKESGFTYAQVKKRIIDIATELPKAAKKIAEMPPFKEVSIIKNITDLINKRSILTIKRIENELKLE